MKKFKLIAFLIGIVSSSTLIFSLCISCSPNQDTLSLPLVFEDISGADIIGTESLDITLNTELPIIPDSLIVYRNIMPNVDYKYATNLAQQFGFNTVTDVVPLIGDTRLVYSYQNEDEVLEIYLNGNIKLHGDINYSQPKNLPSDDECIDIASNWLKSNDIYPDNITSIIANPNIEIEEVDTSSNISNKFILTKIVKFYVDLNGYKLNTCSAFIIIGDDGKVLNAETKYIQPENYQEFNLISATEAINILKQYLEGTLDISEGTCCIANLSGFNQLEITTISIQYIIGADNYIQPIYVFEGSESYLKNNTTESFIGKVDAVVR